MGLFQNNSDPKYELLVNNRKGWRDFAHSWALFGLIALLLSVTVISLIIIWDQIEQVQHSSEELDFVLFGPNKDTSDVIRVSEYRALMYALDYNNASNNVNYPGLSESKRFDTFQHIEKKNPYSLVCYYTLPDRCAIADRLYPENIDANLCSHIIISFTKIHNNTIQLPNERDSEVYKDMVSLKEKNPKLKVLLSIISSSAPGDTFGTMVKNKTNRAMFIKSALNVLNTYSFDGIDLDWEFPSWPTTKSPKQKMYFVELLKEMRTEFNDKYLITVAVAAPIIIAQRAYDIPNIARYADFVNIMCYDYHAFVWYFPFTGANAPLYKSQFDREYSSTLNDNYTIYYWISEGMPKNKIMLGMPTYGHSWTLEYPSIHGYKALAKGFGSIGVKGFVSQRDICSFISLKDTVEVFDGETAVPYAYRQREWISYDNEKSLSYKAELVTELGLAGAMVFSLNDDDYDKSGCHKSVFPLVQAVKNVLQDNNL